MINKKWTYKKESLYLPWRGECVEGYWNIHTFRCPCNHKLMLKLRLDVDELIKQGYKLKRISDQDIRNYDDWEDIPKSSVREVKSWKRNSKRKHQWR